MNHPATLPERTVMSFTGAYTKATANDDALRKAMILPCVVSSSNTLDTLLPPLKGAALQKEQNDRTHASNKYSHKNTSLYFYDPYVNNLTAAETSVLVNAANPHTLTGGGGVDGMFFNAEGQKVNQIRTFFQKYCDQYPVKGFACYPGGLFATEPGRFAVKGNDVYTYTGGIDTSVKTPGSVQALIHTPGPNDTSIPDKIEQRYYLSQCYYNCLIACKKMGCRSVTFPAISTGIFKADEPFKSMLYGIRLFLEQEPIAIDEIRIYAKLSPADQNAWDSCLSQNFSLL